MKKLQAILLMFCIGILITCSTDESIINNRAAIGENPYNNITHTTDTIDETQVDPTNIVGLHQNIFSKKCAVPACHDGSFEPDFRTVLSTYTTLVFHAVLKNSEDSSFTYRVVPGDTSKSWLHERTTTDDSVLGRMPLYDTLSQTRIDQINKWILDGAKDMYGNVPNNTNNEPSLYGINAFINDTNGYRLDTLRPALNPYMAFSAPVDTTIDIWFAAVDNDGGDDYELGYTMSYNKIKYSTDPYGFSNAVEYPLTLHLAGFKGDIFGAPSTIPLFFHHFKFNTGLFNAGDIVYFRIYITDKEHSGVTELPDDGSQYFLQAFFSMEIVNSL